MGGCAVVFLTVGIYQWFDPLNHHYSGNLLILSYVPVAVGLFTLGMTAYFLTFNAILGKTAIELYRWPLGHAVFKLNDLQRIETKGQYTVLHFAGNRKFMVYYSYSGRAYFLERLSGNNSFKPNSLPGAD